MFYGKQVTGKRMEPGYFSPWDSRLEKYKISEEINCLAPAPLGAEAEELQTSYTWL